MEINHWQISEDLDTSARLKELHAWCQAIADTHYSIDKQETLVYLDVDESHYEKWGETIPGASEETLINCVKRNMMPVDDYPNDLFYKFFSLAWDWEEGVEAGGEIDEDGLPTPPPILPLLATWSIAAENMKADEKMAANNFYGQLARLYALDNITQENLNKSYVSHDEYLWGVLNSWLDRCEGNRGLPTAYSSSLRHVGIARSQALIRDQDRIVLHKMFENKGFSARQQMAVDDMERLLKEWLNASDGPSKNLLSVFKFDPKTISELVVAELSVWDGSRETGDINSTQIAQRLLLTATIGGFPTRKLGLSLTVPGNEIEKLVVETVKDGSVEKEPLELEFKPEGDGRLGLSNLVSTDSFTSVLNGLVNLKSDIRHVQRVPRSVVPLRYDDLNCKYVEAESVSLAGRCIILCHKNYEPKVHSILSKIAQEGFKKESELAGLPSDWVLFSEVRVLGSGVDPELMKNPAGRAVYGVLEPDSSSNITLEGGFILPGGGVQTWSLWAPPNLLVSNDKGASQKIRISRQGSTASEPIEEVTPKPVWGTNLSQFELSEGAYLVESFEGTKKSSFQRKRFRLKDADSPVLILKHQFFNFGHSIEDISVSTFGAQREQSDDLLPLNGAYFKELEEPEFSGVLSEITPRWWGERSGDRPADDEYDGVGLGLSLGDINYPDCVKTNAHHWVLGIAVKGKATVDAKCRKCNRESTERAWRIPKSKSNRNNQTTRSTAPNFDSADLSTLEGSQEKRHLVNTAFDGLSYKQQGRWSDLVRVANQVGSSPIEINNFWRALVALGHLEVTRDHLMRPEYWAITPPVLAEATNGRYVLTGFRCKKLVEELQRLVQENGGNFSTNSQIYEESRGGPDVIYVEEVDEEKLQRIAEKVSEVIPRGIPKLSVQPKAGLRLASTLPRLSAVLENCDSETVPADPGEISKYNPITTKYDLVGAAAVPGSYKFTKYSNVYAYRTEQDIENNLRRRVDAYIMKYAAALLAQCPLLGYDGENKLYVPIGADLPGLYGRTAVLSSGQLPKIQNNALVYPDVSPEIAYLLSDRLGS